MTSRVGRDYGGAGDLPRMQHLLRACEPEASYDFHVHDLPEEPQRNVRLWEDPRGTLVAMAAVYAPAWLLFVIHPRTTGMIVETQVIDWASARVAADQHAGAGLIQLRSQARENDGRRMAMLERHGFVPDGGNSLRMERPLLEPIPGPDLPRGFTIRHFDAMQDAEAWAELWKDAGPGRTMSVAQCLSWREPPDIIPALDLIAVAPDGTLAAYCMCSISADENRRTGRADGWTDPIGTRQSFRRRGLARALVLTALAGLRDHGCERALLGVDGANQAAIQLYEACGYRTLYRKIRYSKLLAPKWPS